MKRQITVSDEELSELDAVLSNELSDTRTELRRTRNPAFRKQVNHHIEVIAHIRETVEEAIGPRPEPTKVWPG